MRSTISSDHWLCLSRHPMDHIHDSAHAQLELMDCLKVLLDAPYG